MAKNVNVQTPIKSTKVVKHAVKAPAKSTKAAPAAKPAVKTPAKTAPVKTSAQVKASISTKIQASVHTKLQQSRAKTTKPDVKPTPAQDKAAQVTLEQARSKVKAIIATLPTQKTPANAHITQAVRALKQMTNGLYRLVDLSGEPRYADRVTLLKLLRKADKVLVKTSGITTLVKEFHSAMGVKSTSAAVAAAEFERKCSELYRDAAKAASSLRKADKERSTAALKAALPKSIVIDNKPILPGYKPPSKTQRAVQDAATIREVVAKAAIATDYEVANPIAAPRPSAQVQFSLSDIMVLENPHNGIVMLRLEKPNSQGAICVYNNGRRVAAGVVPPEDLGTYRVLPCDDLVGYINQNLNPFAATEVTESAKAHLNQLLTFCKENTVPEKVSKFAAPVKTAKKVAAKRSPADETVLEPVTEAKAPAKSTPTKAAVTAAKPAAKAAPVKVAAKVVSIKSAPAKTAAKPAAKTAPVKAAAPAKPATKPATKTAVKAAPAKGAKAVAKPAAAAAAAAHRSGHEVKITILIKESPYKPGSKADNTFGLLKKSKTVGQYRQLLKDAPDPSLYQANYLTWCTEPHGNQPALIKLG